MGNKNETRTRENKEKANSQKAREENRTSVSTSKRQSNLTMITAATDKWQNNKTKVTTEATATRTHENIEPGANRNFVRAEFVAANHLKSRLPCVNDSVIYIHIL